LNTKHVPHGNFFVAFLNVCMKWGGGGVEGRGWHSLAVFKLFSRLFPLRSVVVWPSDQRVETTISLSVWSWNIVGLSKRKMPPNSYTPWSTGGDIHAEDSVFQVPQVSFLFFFELLFL
jgi:hypothetical protein